MKLDSTRDLRVLTSKERVINSPKILHTRGDEDLRRLDREVLVAFLPSALAGSGLLGAIPQPVPPPDRNNWFGARGSLGRIVA